LRSLALVNDFKAVAYAAHFLNEADMTAIAGDGAIQPGLPRLVVGPGTGLGAAVLIPATPHVRVLTSEGGHAALAARNALELEIVRRLGHGVEHVLNERVLSGPGLLTLYRVLGAIRGTPTPLQTPAQVSTAALAGNDLLARECIEVFCAWLGSLVGDLVMLFGAYGGVYLAGGVLPQILPLLERSEFVSRLKAKGALTDVLARVPVRLIEHGQLGVRGAAHWFVDHELKADESLHESK
jgi:glucokinase